MLRFIITICLLCSYSSIAWASQTDGQSEMKIETSPGETDLGNSLILEESDQDDATANEQSLFEGIKPQDAIENSELSDIPLDTLNLPSSQITVSNLFNGLGNNEIYQSLSTLRLLSTTPTAHRLKVILLSSGIDESAADTTDHTLLNLRIQQLMLMGEFSKSEMLINHIPVNRRNASIEQLHVELYFLQTRYAEGCPIVDQQIYYGAKGNFWRFASFVCSLVKHDSEKAQLAYSLLEEEQLLPSGSLGNLMRQTLAGSTKNATLTPLLAASPLALALLDVGQINVTANNLKALNPATLALISSTLKTSIPTRIQAAELLLGTGNYPPSSLLALYQSLPSPPLKKKTKENPVSLRARLAKELASKPNTIESLTTIGALADAYTQAGIADQGMLYIANIVHELDIPQSLPNSVLAASPTALRAAILEQNNTLSNELINQLKTKPLTGSLSQTFAKLRIASEALQWSEDTTVSQETVSTWQQYATSIAAPERDRYLAFITSLLHALEIQTPDAINTSLASDEDSDNLALIKKLDKDFPKTYPAKTILLALGIIEHQPTPKDQPLLLTHIAHALYNMELKNEAIDIARLAVILASKYPF